jgi:hypothetical protein
MLGKGEIYSIILTVLKTEMLSLLKDAGFENDVRQYQNN